MKEVTQGHKVQRAVSQVYIVLKLIKQYRRAI